MKLLSAQAENDERQDEARRAPRALLCALVGSVRGRVRTAADRGPAHRRRFFRALSHWSSRGGKCPSAHYVRGRMAREQQQTGTRTLEELFAAEPDRLSRLSFEVAGLYFDWSKTHLDQGSDRAFHRAGGADGFRRRTRRACSRARSSIRAKAARRLMSPSAASGAPEDVDLATARRQRMRALIDAIEAGAFGDVTGVLHIGIGGSRARPGAAGRRAGTALGQARRALPVQHRRRCVRRGGEAARSRRRPWSSSPRRPSPRWRRCQHGRRARMAARRRRRRPVRPRDRGDRRARKRRWMPASTRPASCRSARASAGAIRCGARSALPAALALGWDAFEALLEGAAEMDRHFRFAEPRSQCAADRRVRRPPLRRGARVARRAASSPMTSGCGCCLSISSSWRWN